MAFVAGQPVKVTFPSGEKREAVVKAPGGSLVHVEYERVDGVMVDRWMPWGSVDGNV